MSLRNTFLAAVLAACAALSLAGPPNTLSYQGYLTAAGTPINSPVNLTFKLYTAATGGAAFWTETQSSVPVNKGLYSVILGNSASLSGVAFDAVYWLGVTVNTDPEMTPRQALTSAPYTFRAKVADTATMATTATTATTASTLSSDALAVYGLTGGMPPRTTTTTSFAGAYGGPHISIAMAPDGLPVVSYSSGGLMVIKCGNTKCSNGNTVTQVRNSGGAYSSITIGADGLPVISHFDSWSDYLDLRVTKCGNPSCTSGNTSNPVDTEASVGWYSSITIGSDGYPVISYYDATNGNLKLAKCNSADCNLRTNNVISVVDSVGDVGKSTSITLNSEGTPVMSYYDVTNGNLKVATCVSAACEDFFINTVDSTGDVGQETSIALGSDGFPIIAYRGNGLKIAKCNDMYCASSNITSIAGTAYNPSIVIGLDGNPIIAFNGWGYNLDLRIVKCGNASCTSGNVTSIVDASFYEETGSYPSITSGMDGAPVIAHFSNSGGYVKVSKCANVVCTNYLGRR